MATLSKARRLVMVRLQNRCSGRFVPRSCMVVAVGLICAGLTLPLLMAIDWLPVNFAMGFLGWALVAVGGYRLLTGSGEI